MVSANNTFLYIFLISDHQQGFLPAPDDWKKKGEIPVSFQTFPRVKFKILIENRSEKSAISMLLHCFAATDYYFQCHFFWSKSMQQVKISLEKWLFNPSYLIWFKRYAAAKRISPSSTATFRQIIFWCIFCKLMLHNHVKLQKILEKLE